MEDEWGGAVCAGDEKEHIGNARPVLGDTEPHRFGDNWDRQEAVETPRGAR